MATQITTTVTNSAFDVGQQGQFWMNWLVLLFTGIVTSVGIIFVLVKERVRPKLRLSFLSSIGERSPVTATPTTGATITGFGRWYHLRLRNERPWQPAKNVQVYLIRLEEKGPDGRWQTRWANQVPIRCRHQEFFPPFRTIGPATDYDICSVMSDRRLALCPLFQPLSLPIGTTQNVCWLLSFEARADHGASPTAKIQIAWDGEWADGDTEMQNHFKIEDVTGTV